MEGAYLPQRCVYVCMYVSVYVACMSQCQLQAYMCVNVLAPSLLNMRAACHSWLTTIYFYYISTFFFAFNCPTRHHSNTQCCLVFITITNCRISNKVTEIYFLFPILLILFPFFTSFTHFLCAIQYDNVQHTPLLHATAYSSVYHDRPIEIFLCNTADFELELT